MPSQDIYFICQMVDRSLADGLAFAPKIEAFMGDASCVVLLENYPKFTPLHEYIKFVVSDVIWEETKVNSPALINGANYQQGQKLWVDHLLDAYEFNTSFLEWFNKTTEEIDVEKYFLYLGNEGIMDKLLDEISKEAFHILFSNRKVLWNFCDTAAFQILESAECFYPEVFNNRGYLQRARIPQWAKNAVYHRDKGLCVNCKTDLTRLINLKNSIHYDHVIPLSKGGMNDVINLQILCEKCNKEKSARLESIPCDYHSWYPY